MRTVDGAARAAVNIGGGFHHAFPAHGEGFCLFNDVAVAVRVLQHDRTITRAAIARRDVHQGNGTAFTFENDDSVFTFSITRNTTTRRSSARFAGPWVCLTVPATTSTARYSSLRCPRCLPLGRTCSSTWPARIRTSVITWRAESDVEGLAGATTSVFNALATPASPWPSSPGGYARTEADTAAYSTRHDRRSRPPRARVIRCASGSGAGRIPWLVSRTLPPSREFSADCRCLGEAAGRALISGLGRALISVVRGGPASAGTYPLLRAQRCRRFDAGNASRGM